MIRFDNSYARLPESFYATLDPTPVKAPALIAFNEALADELGLDLSGLDAEDLAALFSGNRVPEGARPIAQAYAGHQFGSWNPQLGDGRAHLLGEVISPAGERFDIQLKGSGPTPFSRMGDGRAWVGPVIREYLMSEAMHALGIPTTRALAAVTTGEEIARETMLPGAVLTRVASSHIRVGTFQYFAGRGDRDSLAALFEHTRARHFPEARSVAEVLAGTVERQAKLLAQWMSVGFIHGVMNTDNCHVAGLTIDYGPCAFMDAYHPRTVFSSIDQGGRYAYAAQPQIALWNLAQFASALVPLCEDQDAAVEEFTEIINRFADIYQDEWLRRFGSKIGLPDLTDSALVEELLKLMAQDGADFTNTFKALEGDAARDQFLDREAFDAWEAKWRAAAPDLDLMARTNPVVIPRLHRIEQAIEDAVTGDFGKFERMLEVVTHPFEMSEEALPYTRPPTKDERVTRTFCGT